MLVIIPYFKNFSEYSSYEKDTYNAILERATELNIFYIDMKTYFEKEANWKEFRRQDRPWDYNHTNIRGHKLIAETIFAHFEKNRLVK